MTVVNNLFQTQGCKFVLIWNIKKSAEEQLRYMETILVAASYWLQ